MSSKENSHQTSKIPNSVAARVLMFEEQNKSNESNFVNNISNIDSSDHSKASSSSSRRNTSFKGRFDFIIS